MNTRFLIGGIMQKTIIFCFLVLVFVSQGCDPNTQTICTEEARPGLNINVVDGQNGYYLSDSATVIAIDGAYSEVLQMEYDYYYDAPFVGVYERPGSYQVITSHVGYKNDTTLVQVSEDECHVITENRTISMYP